MICRFFFPRATPHVYKCYPACLTLAWWKLKWCPYLYNILFSDQSLPHAERGGKERYHSHQGSRQSLSNSIHFPFCLRQATGSVHNYSYGPQCFYSRLRVPQFHLAKARKYGNMLTYRPLLSLHWPGYSALHCRSP